MTQPAFTPGLNPQMAMPFVGTSAQQTPQQFAASIKSLTVLREHMDQQHKGIEDQEAHIETLKKDIAQWDDVWQSLDTVSMNQNYQPSSANMETVGHARFMSRRIQGLVDDSRKQIAELNTMLDALEYRESEMEEVEALHNSGMSE